MFSFDFHGLVAAPVEAMLSKLAGFLPTLISATIILVVGWLVAKVIKLLLEKILEVIQFEHFADKSGISGVLGKGDIRLTTTEVLSTISYYVAMIMVLMLVLNVLGVAFATHLLDGLIAYIPAVFTAVFVLTLGFFLARFVSIIVRVCANNAGLPRPDLLESVSHMAIVVYALILSLKELGLAMLFEGPTATIFFAGIVLAGSIAFGLGGKDAASKYIKKLK